MKKNGRHHAPTGRVTARRIGLGTRWPDGFRPLSLVPPLPDEPNDQHDPGAQPASHAQHGSADGDRARERSGDAPALPGPRPVRRMPLSDSEATAAHRAWMRQIHQECQDDLAARWGGLEALEALDAEALPVEPFDWSSVPDAHRERVEHILALVDHTSSAAFDHEHRTACRRLLARVAGEPEVIAHRGKVETIAGTIVWTIASFNGTTGRRRRGSRIVPASSIAWHLGLSSGSAFAKRSVQLCAAAGIRLHRDGPEPVGEAGLITSQRRRHAVWLREKYRAALE